MNRLIGIAVVVLVVAVTGTEGFARGGRGGGSGGGGQQRMGNASGASQYGYGGQMGAMQQQMIQNRYRMMQSQPRERQLQQARLMNGANAGQMAQGRQAMQGNLGGRRATTCSSNAFGMVPVVDRAVPDKQRVPGR